MTEVNYKAIIEAALFAASEPLSLQNLQQLFDEHEAITANDIKAILASIETDYAERGVVLKRVASGFRFQAREAYANWLSRLWQQKPPRYSRAVFETLALIAYRQPITRGEIEEVRGVVVSSDVIKKLMDRDWIKIAGHKEVPGKPAMFITTKAFLDYFNLKSLADLPALEKVVDLEAVETQLKEQLALNMKVEEVENYPATVTQVIVEQADETDSAAELETESLQHIQQE